MLNFIALSLSIAVLGYLLFWTFIKRDVPKQVHNLFYRQREFNLKKDQGKWTPMAEFSMWIVILIAVTTYNIVGSFYEEGIAIFNLDSNLNGFLIWFGVFMAIAIPVGQHTSKIFGHYVTFVKTREERDGLRVAHGARSMGTVVDLKKLTNNQGGFYIGAPHFHWFGEGNKTLIGGTGSGKTASIIISNFLSALFTATGTSAFVIDPKGEIYAVVKDWLESQGYYVLRLNPADLFGMGTNHFNLFDMVRREKKETIAYCQSIAASLSPIKGKSETADHFNDKAQGLLFAYMLYMIDKFGEDASFVKLYELITAAGRKRTELLEEMSESTAFNGVLASEAGSILAGYELGGEREMSSVYSTADKSLKAFRNLQMRDIVQKSDFDLTDLIEKPTAIFINVEFGNLEDSAGWIRSMIGVLSRMMEKRTSRSRRLLFMLDEFVQLGHVKEVEKGFVTLRSFGVTYHIVVQDLQMLKTHYPGSYKSFFSSSAVKHVLNVEDPEMAKMLSDMTGKNVNTVKFGDNPTPHIVEKPVVSPDDFQNNHSHHYLFLRGMPNVVKLPKVPYYDNPIFDGRWNPNPLYSESV